MLINFVKAREYSKGKRVAAKHFLKAGHSFVDTARKVGYSKSAEYLILQRFEKTGSIKTKAREGGPKKIQKWRKELFAEHPGSYASQL